MQSEALKRDEPLAMPAVILPQRSSGTVGLYELVKGALMGASARGDFPVDHSRDVLGRLYVFRPFLLASCFSHINPLARNTILFP